MMVQAPQQDLERAFINKFCGSFNKNFQRILEDIGFHFTLEVIEPFNVLKLVLSCHTVEEYRLLRYKQQALRYKVKRLAPPVQRLLVVYIPWSERIPTKHKGVYLRTISDTPFPCLVIDTKSGSTAEITVDDEMLGVGRLTQEQAKNLFVGLFGENNNLRGGRS